MAAKFDKTKLVSFFLRIGLATVFLYAGIAAVMNPEAWIGFIPAWIQDFFPGKVILFTHATFNVILSMWLLSGKKIFYASFLAGGILLSIIIFNLGSLDIVFRDAAIFFSAAAAAVLHYKDAK